MSTTKRPDLLPNDIHKITEHVDKIATMHRPKRNVTADDLDYAVIMGQIDNIEAGIKRVVSERDQLLEALKGVMGGQLTGQVDTDAPRFQAAREAILRVEGKTP